MQPASDVASSSSKAGERGLFDCNICLDTASDPVITVCGHLYWCAAGLRRAQAPFMG